MPADVPAWRHEALAAHVAPVHHLGEQMAGSTLGLPGGWRSSDQGVKRGARRSVGGHHLARAE